MLSSRFKELGLNESNTSFRCLCSRTCWPQVHCTKRSADSRNRDYIHQRGRPTPTNRSTDG